MIFELANKKDNMGKFINEKITIILKNIEKLIPSNPNHPYYFMETYGKEIFFLKKINLLALLIRVLSLVIMKWRLLI